MFKHSGLVALMDTCELESGIEKETTEAVQIQLGMLFMQWRA